MSFSVGEGSPDTFVGFNDFDCVSVNEGKIPEKEQHYDVQDFLVKTAARMGSGTLEIIKLREKIAALDEIDQDKYQLRMQLDELVDTYSNERINAGLNHLKNRLKEEQRDLQKLNKVFPLEARLIRIDILQGEINAIRSFQKRHKIRPIDNALDKGSFLLMNARRASDIAVTSLGSAAQHTASSLGTFAYQTAQNIGGIVQQASDLGDIVSKYLPKNEE